MTSSSTESSLPDIAGGCDDGFGEAIPPSVDDVLASELIGSDPAVDGGLWAGGHLLVTGSVTEPGGVAAGGGGSGQRVGGAPRWGRGVSGGAESGHGVRVLSHRETPSRVVRQQQITAASTTSGEGVAVSGMGDAGGGGGAGDGLREGRGLSLLSPPGVGDRAGAARSVQAAADEWGLIAAGAAACTFSAAAGKVSGSRTVGARVPRDGGGAGDGAESGSASRAQPGLGADCADDPHSTSRVYPVRAATSRRVQWDGSLGWRRGLARYVRDWAKAWVRAHIPRPTTQSVSSRTTRLPSWFLKATCAVTVIVMVARLWPLWVIYPDAYALPLDETFGEVTIIGHRPQVAGYERGFFGTSWGTAPEVGRSCTTRSRQLVHDIPGATVDQSQGRCRISGGVTRGRYTGKEITASAAVEIDHIYPLAAAWDMGAHAWDPLRAYQFANDPINLVAVAREANRDKSDSTPAAWLPPDRRSRCWYARRYALVAARYQLPITRGDATALLLSCPRDLPRVVRVLVTR